MGLSTRNLRANWSARQIGALPFRVAPDGHTEFLLITSRTSGRWIIPKGWPVFGLAPHLSGAKEAFEEAGVRGTAGQWLVGKFPHHKTRLARELTIEVYPLRVEQELEDWPEGQTRQRRWFRQHKAAQIVQNQELGKIIAGFSSDLFVQEPARERRPR